MEFRVQQKCTTWIETKVEADNLEEAIEKADAEMKSGWFVELSDSWEFDGEYWAEDENGKEYGVA